MLLIGRIFADSGDMTVAWTGGPYIDIYMGADEDVPTETINVWDYEKDRPFVKRRAKDMCQFVVRWLQRERDITDIQGFGYRTVDPEID